MDPLLQYKIYNEKNVEEKRLSIEWHFGGEIGMVEVCEA